MLFGATRSKADADVTSKANVVFVWFDIPKDDERAAVEDCLSY